MARNDKLNKKFRDTVIGAKIMREVPIVLSRMNKLNDLIEEAKQKIIDGEPIVDIFKNPEELDEMGVIFDAIQGCLECKEILKLINEPDPTEETPEEETPI